MWIIVWLICRFVVLKYMNYYKAKWQNFPALSYVFTKIFLVMAIANSSGWGYVLGYVIWK